jgi:hypothetical protein
LLGHQEARALIAKQFHNEPSAPLLLAIMAVDNAKSELREKGSPEAEQVHRASELLSRFIETVSATLLNQKRSKTAA